MRKILLAAGLAIGFGLIAWTSASRGAGQWQLTNVTGHLPDLAFSLTDENNRPVTAQDYRGRIVLLYFGFAGCSAQCPLTLERLKGLLSRPGGDAARVLFVSVDPANDTPAALHRYLASFDPAHMTGLTGSDAAVETLAKRLRAAYRPGDALPGDTLTGDRPHSNVIYLFDAMGHARLLATPEDTDEQILHDLQRLTDEH